MPRGAPCLAQQLVLQGTKEDEKKVLHVPPRTEYCQNKQKVILLQPFYILPKKKKKRREEEERGEFGNTYTLGKQNLASSCPYNSLTQVLYLT